MVRHESFHAGRPGGSTSAPPRKNGQESPTRSKTRCPARDTPHPFILLAEQSPDAVLRLSRDGTIIYANARACDWLETAQDAIAGANIRDLWNRVGSDGFWPGLLEETCATGIPGHLHLSVKKRTRTHVLDIHTARESATAAPVDAVVATIRDTTDRHLRELQLQEANQRLHFHINNSPLAVIEWEPSGFCATWNDEAESLFGWTRTEAAKKLSHCQALIHRDDRPRFLETYENLLAGKETSAFIQCRTISRNNAVSWCEWYLSSLMDDAGESRGILCLVNDVTDRELSERKLQTLVATLEKKIELRSKLLEAANDNLKREHLVRRQLERDMIGISEREHRRIGHDLHDGICQELAGIRFAIAAMAASNTQNKSLRSRLLQIEEAILRAMHEARLLARGLAPMELEDGDLDSSLRELAKNTARLHAISCRVAWRGPKLIFPPDTATHLFRIAQEALHNSIHHGAATTIHLRIAISPRSIRLTIDDNGHGLPPGPSTPAEGRGMGRKIMQHRAAIINGRVSLAPRKNARGTRVVCTLPHPPPHKPCQTEKKPRSKSKSSKTTP